VLEVAVRKSPIGGFGVFAVRSFDAGALIRELNLGREITRDMPLRPGEGERLEHCTVVDGRLFLVGSPDRYFNHSCDPNDPRPVVSRPLFPRARANRT
jgi:SET domain-containing protein